MAELYWTKMRVKATGEIGIDVTWDGDNLMYAYLVGSETDPTGPGGFQPALSPAERAVRPRSSLASPRRLGSPSTSRPSSMTPPLSCSLSSGP